MNDTEKTTLDKFSPDFIDRYRDNPVFITAVNQLSSGESPYLVIERLVDALQKRTDELLNN